KHSLHAGTQVFDGNCFDVVVAQELRHAGMMGAFGALVMQRVPADRELLPVVELATANNGDGDALRAAPARINGTVRCDGYTDLNNDQRATAGARTLHGATRAVAPTPV